VRVACISSLDGRLCIKKAKEKERIQQKNSTNTNSQTNKLYSYLILFNQQSSAPKPIHHPSFSIPTVPTSSLQIQNLLLHLQLKSRFLASRLISLTLSLTRKLRLHPTNQTPYSAQALRSASSDKARVSRNYWTGGRHHVPTS